MRLASKSQWSFAVKSQWSLPSAANEACSQKLIKLAKRKAGRNAKFIVLRSVAPAKESVSWSCPGPCCKSMGTKWFQQAPNSIFLIESKSMLQYSWHLLPVPAAAQKQTHFPCRKQRPKLPLLEKVWPAQCLALCTRIFAIGTWKQPASCLWESHGQSFAPSMNEIVSLVGVHLLKRCHLQRHQVASSEIVLLPSILEAVCVHTQQYCKYLMQICK